MEAKINTKQTKECNQQHAVKELSNLSPGDCVYITDHKENAVVVGKRSEPRSYYLDTDSNATVRRNRQQFRLNSKEVNYSLGSPLCDPPEASED